jgi:hypothetical protein
MANGGSFLGLKHHFPGVHRRFALCERGCNPSRQAVDQCPCCWSGSERYVSPIGDGVRPNNNGSQRITSKKQAAYEGARIIVGGTKRFDAFDIITEEMKLDRFEAERLWLPTRRFQQVLGCASGLAPASLGILGARLNGFELGACHTHKVPQTSAQCCRSVIKEAEGRGSVHVQFGQRVPCCEQKDEIENCRIMRFGKEPFQTGNYTLPGSKV